MSTSENTASLAFQAVIHMVEAREVSGDSASSAILEIANEGENRLSPWERLHQSLAAMVVAQSDATLETAAGQYKKFASAFGQTDPVGVLEKMVEDYDDQGHSPKIAAVIANTMLSTVRELPKEEIQGRQELFSTLRRVALQNALTPAQ